MNLTGCGHKDSNAQSIDGGQGSPETQSTLADQVPLRVAVAPYQDISLLMAEKELGLENKYGTKLEFLTMPWEEIIPAVASAGTTVDVGFASLADFMCKSEQLNKGADDPLLYVYPAYVFHGGAFVTFNPDVPEITAKNVNDKSVLKKFLGFKNGVQKNSCCHMLLWQIARDAGVQFSTLQITDTTLNDGLLAAQNGSLDTAAAGLTQRTEALKRKGRVAVDMDTLKLIDITGFICKESVYRKRAKDVQNLIRMWFDSSKYVLDDPEDHSKASLAYLNKNASTHYTIDEFKKALSQEYFPLSAAEAKSKIVSQNGDYSFQKISKLCGEYLLDIGATKSMRPAPELIDLPAN